MCSIFAVLNINGDLQALRQLALKQSRLMRHRGPDWSGIHTCKGAVLAHERLAIVDVNTGAQPLFSPDGKQSLAVNGEIYNHKTLRANLTQPFEFATESDCEVILPLYLEKGSDFINDLHGMFAFVLYDETNDRHLIARDPIGIIPLYYGYDDEHQLYVASEMKALMGICTVVMEFPPGHYWSSEDEQPTPYYQREWQDFSAVENAETDIKAIGTALEKSVISHLMTDVPYGVLLSGGLDSSIIAAVTQKHAGMRVEDDERSPAWWPRLHSFAVGLKGSPDLAAAEKVAEHIGTVHHGFEFTLQEGLDALDEVIYHIETYDHRTPAHKTFLSSSERRTRMTSCVSSAVASVGRKICARMGAIPAPPPMNTISLSVSLAKNSPYGPEIVALSPGLRLKMNDDMMPGGIESSAPGGGVAIRTFSLIVVRSSGKLAIE